MKHTLRKIACILLTLALWVSAFPQAAEAANGGITCKTLCGSALKATGGSKNLKYSSKSAMDFGALSSSARKKVKNIQYVCDAKEVYSLCVIETKNSTDATNLLNVLKKYKKRNCKSDYLSDYSTTEKNVFKNAICGKKKNYVWYIAMSPDKKDNTKGQTALKKKM